MGSAVPRIRGDYRLRNGGTRYLRQFAALPAVYRGFSVAIQTDTPFGRFTLFSAPGLSQGFRVTNAIQPPAVGPANLGVDFVQTSRTAGVTR